MNDKIILCIDDEKYILDSLRNELEDVIGDNYILEFAQGGEEALKLYDELKDTNFLIPLVISDYIMPDIRGDEVLKIIKEKDSNSYCIMLTGQATIEGVTNALNKADLYRFIGKPWDSADLRLTIKEALKSYEKDMQIKIHQKELEIAHKKLLKLDESKNYFLNLLSHELNTPLTGIKMAVQLLQSDIENAEILELIDLIAQSSQRLIVFAEKSIFITQLMNEKYEIRIGSYDIITIIEEGIRFFNNKIIEKNLKITRNFQNQIINLNSDFVLLRKCFDIILDNSIKNSPDNEEIELILTIDNDILILTIKDKGKGFDEKYLENSFSFFTSDEILYHGEGYGLGLSTAELIMKALNGKIEIGNNLEKGAYVKLTLPIK